MIVELAGYNVDADTLNGLDGVDREVLTPETFSAAYARISRSAKNVTALRKQARMDVKKARKSNQAIIFDMGHHSVAEHAVFNFDIIGISRLALEELEQFRLVSFTEKSQRYVTLKGDFLVPTEIVDDESRELFKDTVSLQNTFYEKAFSLLKDHIFNKHPLLAEKKSNKSLLEGWAKEDARYILSVATEGQVGMTINARNLEHLFRRFHLSRRSEVNELGKRLFELVEKIAPSIFLFSQPSNFSKDLSVSFKDNFSKKSFAANESLSLKSEPKIVRFTDDGDDIILASFLSVFNSMNFNEAFGVIRSMDDAEKDSIFKDLFKRMEFFDSVPREFEMVDITFQAVISASNFAQLKRHRMASLLQGAYDISFGNVVPDSIKEVGLEGEFLELIEKTNRVYLKLKDKYGEAADYILTNSHCRMVVMKMNMREFYHFIRLRDDQHAQWDIRLLAHSLLEQAKAVLPKSALLLCGKSDFIERFENIYKRKPDFSI
ncbi:MAG: FAD-dependent thymidylate synthase [bacterium]|nr:FAD-dependent thymidylate synthase [bacterium]